MKESTLLEIDGIGNIILGLPLFFFPVEVTTLLGMSSNGSSFYPIILGAIFIGIGIALLVQRFKPTAKGLGLGGAMSINLVFGIVLTSWLIGTNQDLTLIGSVVLWGLAIILIGISSFEWFYISRKN